MAREIKAGYSAGIRNAGGETGKFADKTLGAINQVDKALSGTAAKLAAFGLSFSLGAVTKDIIELDHRMARVGLTANAGALRGRTLQSSTSCFGLPGGVYSALRPSMDAWGTPTKPCTAWFCPR
jgi:hypothetical protein